MAGNRSAIRKNLSQKIALILIAAAWAALAALPFAVTEERVAPTADAASGGKSYIVMEQSSMRVLSDSNADARLPMASTTKVMTALVAIENSDPAETVTIPKEAVGIEGSSIYLKNGEKFTLEELLYGLMLRSGNDAATAIAVHVGGSVENFVKMMNERARSMGLKNTSFANPHGLSAENHYTSAYDLAVIAATALNNDLFKKIVSTKNVTVPGNEFRETRYFANKNKLLYNYTGATGVKIGFTTEAGRCLVASSERDGMEVVAVALNYYDYFDKCAALMDYAYENYRMERVISPDFVYKTVKVEGNRKIKSADLKAVSAKYYPIKKDGSEKISCAVEAPDVISAPHKASDATGNVKVFLGNRLLFEEKLYTIDIEKKGIFSLFGK